MKKLVILILLSPLVAFAQTQINGFQLKQGKLLYQNVFSSELTIDELGSVIRRTLKIDITEQSKNLITGYIKKIDAHVYAKKNGYEWGSIPAYIYNNNISGIINIEIKEGKYRITISDLYLQNQYTTSTKVRNRQAGDIQQLEDVVLTLNKDRIQNNFLNNGSKIYDLTFKELFDFNNSEIILDNNF